MTYLSGKTVIEKIIKIIMHEYAITKNIVDTVKEYIDSENITRVNTINLRFGALKGIVPDSVHFAFDSLKKDIPALQDTELNIEISDMKARCKECGHEYEPEKFNLFCPNCGSSNTEVLAGKEMEIVNMEVEKNDQEQ